MPLHHEGGGTVCCLVEAPNKGATIAVHREAHGLVADEIADSPPSGRHPASVASK
jgi:hypothetical protein